MKPLFYFEIKMLRIVMRVSELFGRNSSFNILLWLTQDDKLLWVMQGRGSRSGKSSNYFNLCLLDIYELYFTRRLGIWERNSEKVTGVGKFCFS